MYLFIFESIGTSELILVGIVALIFLGPRKLPEIARTVGKFMAEFRGTANEFKDTWKREVDFEEETKALNLNEIEGEASSDVSKKLQSDEQIPNVPTKPVEPAIKEIDPSQFEQLKIEFNEKQDANADDQEVKVGDNDKQNWL